MKKLFLLFILTFIHLTLFSQYRQHSVDMNLLPQHPRILLLDGEEKELRKMVDSDVYWKKIHDEIISGSEKLLHSPLIEYKLTGRRMLNVSRGALRNIFFLSYAYRVTKDKAYAKRAESELLAVANFPSWNPSHFLDVGEMALGVAIGYDWLYDFLPPNSKETIKGALLTKALEPSNNKEYNNFLSSKNNWNQVCNAGMLYAALAVAEDYPELSKEVIERSINTYYMGTFAPDGVYAEGVGYWSYGTSNVALFISALEKVFSNDFGLISEKGFSKTAEYAQSMIAPDYRIFNYSDSGEFGRTGLNTTLFWFASRFNDPSLLWFQKKELDKREIRQSGNRILPALLIWSKGLKSKDITAPEKRMFYGQGINPVALMRTTWKNDKKALFLGYKLGTPRVSHAHMDIGSFVFVANGIRWAADLGMQDYESLESKGLNIWNYKQNSQRWQVFRLNNKSHNTLIVNDNLQNVNAKAQIDKVLDSDVLMYAISDLSEIYKNQLKNVKRGVAIVDSKFAVIRDEITTLEETTNIKWNMLTYTDVDEISGNKATLIHKGKKLTMRIDSPKDAVFTTQPATPPNSWDVNNKNARFVVIEYNTKGGQNVVIQVSLIPDFKSKDNYDFFKQLDNW